MWPQLITAPHQVGTAFISPRKISPVDLSLTQPGVIAHYLRLSFWPSEFCLDYGWPGANRLEVVLLPAVVIALARSDALGLSEAAGLGILSAWFFAILAPTSSFVPLRGGLRASHVSVLGGAGDRPGQWAVWAGGPVAGASRDNFAATTASRRRPLAHPRRGRAGNSHLPPQSGVSQRSGFWEDNVAKTPDNARAHNNLGVAQISRGQIDAAIDQYEQA